MLIRSTQSMHHIGLEKQMTVTMAVSLGLVQIIVPGGEYNLMEDQSWSVK